MLVLSRTTRQQLVIDGQITITILEIKGRRARIGIEAPDSVRVIRGELAFDPPAAAHKAQADSASECPAQASQSGPGSGIVSQPPALPRSPRSVRPASVTSEWRVPAEQAGGERTPAARPEGSAPQGSPLAGRVARRHAIAQLASQTGATLEAIPQVVAV